MNPLETQTTTPFSNQQNFLDGKDNPFSPKGRLMCADKTGGFNLVNYRYSSGVYHEQKAKDLYSRI